MVGAGEVSIMIWAKCVGPTRGMEKIQPSGWKVTLNIRSDKAWAARRWYSPRFIVRVNHSPASIRSELLSIVRSDDTDFSCPAAKPKMVRCRFSAVEMEVKRMLCPVSLDSRTISGLILWHWGAGTLQMFAPPARPAVHLRLRFVRPRLDGGQFSRCAINLLACSWRASTTWTRLMTAHKVRALIGRNALDFVRAICTTGN